METRELCVSVEEYVLIYSHDHGITWAYKSCYHGELFDGIAGYSISEDINTEICYIKY